MTPKQFKNKYAIQHGYSNWNDLVGQVDEHDFHIDQCMQEYADYQKDFLNEPPEPVDQPDFMELEILCQEYIQEIYTEKNVKHEDWDVEIAECAMKCVYGNDIYNWINPHIR